MYGCLSKIRELRFIKEQDLSKAIHWAKIQPQAIPTNYYGIIYTKKFGKI